MATLLRRNYAQRAPAPGSTINWDHPLAFGLRLCMIPAGGNAAVDLVSGRVVSKSGAPAEGNAAAGGRNPIFSPKLDASNAWNFGNGSSTDLTGAMTLIASAWNNSVTNEMLIARDSDSLGRGYTLDTHSNGARFYLNGASNGIINSGGTPLTNSQQFQIAASYNGVSNGYLYLDGVQKTAGVGVFTAPSSTTANLKVGYRDYAGNEGKLNGGISYAYVIAREYSPAEIAWINAEPFAFITPAGPKISYFDFQPPVVPDRQIVTTLHRPTYGRTTPPPGATIDWSHPLAQGLELCVLGSSPVDLVTAARFTPNGSAFSGRRGDGFRLASSTSDYMESTTTIPDTGFIKPSGLSLLWAGVIDAGAANRHLAGKHSGNGALNNPFDFRTDTSNPNPLIQPVRAGPVAGFNQWNSTAAISVGIPHQAGVSWPTNNINATMSAYIDGVLKDTIGGSGTSEVITGSSQPVRIGRRADGGVQMDGTTKFVYAWSRPLTQYEFAWLNAEPYAFITHPAQRMVFDLGVAPSLVTTGSLKLHSL